MIYAFRIEILQVFIIGEGMFLSLTLSLVSNLRRLILGTKHLLLQSSHK